MMKLIYLLLLASMLTLDAVAAETNGLCQFFSTNIVHLTSIRNLLTTNLTIDAADKHLGEPRLPSTVHGCIYSTWRLDDGNLLSIAFELLLPGRLLWARVEDANHKVIEDIVKDRRNANNK